MKVRSWVAVAVVLGLFLLVPAGGAMGRSRHRGPTAQKFVAATIQVHNGFANIVHDEFVGPESNYANELDHCRQVEAMTGEVRSDEEKALREKQQNNFKAAESLQDFNSGLSLWRRAFRTFGSGLPRAKRQKLNGAIARIAAAHTAHEKEFFDVKGIWVQIESVSCATAAEMRHEAEAAGGHAWTQEFLALVEVAHLFHVTRPPVEYPVGPYVQE